MAPGARMNDSEEKENLLLLMENERFLGRPARDIVTVAIELFIPRYLIVAADRPHSRCSNSRLYNFNFQKKANHDHRIMISLSYFLIIFNCPVTGILLICVWLTLKVIFIRFFWAATTSENI